MFSGLILFSLMFFNMTEFLEAGLEIIRLHLAIVFICMAASINRWFKELLVPTFLQQEQPNRST